MQVLTSQFLLLHLKRCLMTPYLRYPALPADLWNIYLLSTDAAAF